MSREHRKVYDYYQDGDFLFRIGYVRFLDAFPPTLFHEHGNMTEFTYLERGTQNYQIGDKLYTVHQGDVFFTLPYELHNTGIFPEEIGSLYYLIIDLSLIEKLHVFLFPEEYSEIRHFFENREERIYRASPTLPHALRRLLQECLRKPDSHFDTRVRNALSEVLIALAVPSASGQDEDLLSIRRSLCHIQNHLRDTIRISDLSAMENMSLSSFNRLFTRVTGVTPGDYILKAKIEKTKELLRCTDMPVTEIALEYGFSSSQYFATVFKRFCYATPTQYRKKRATGPSSS